MMRRATAPASRPSTAAAAVAAPAGAASPAMAARPATAAAPATTRLSAAEQKKVERALQARFYLLPSIGPMAFVVGVDVGADEMRRYNVKLGAHSSCSCHQSQCVHLLFVLLRVLKVVNKKQNNMKRKIELTCVSFAFLLLLFFLSLSLSFSFLFLFLIIGAGGRSAAVFAAARLRVRGACVAVLRGPAQDLAPPQDAHRAQ